MAWNDDRTIGLIGYTSAPTGIFKGQTYFNTTSNGAFVWDGSSWVAMSGGGGGGNGIYGGSGTVPSSAVATLTDKLVIGGFEINDSLNRVSINGYLFYQTSLGNSTYFGNNAGSNDDLTNNSNTGFGFNALQNVSSGFGNTGVGRDALVSVTTEAENVAFGYRAGGYGGSNVSIGAYVMLSSDATSTHNIGIGHSALQNTNNVANNIAIGSNALSDGGLGGIQGSNNVAIGTSALKFSEITDSAVAIGLNVGQNAENVSNSVIIGGSAGQSLDVATNNIYIGYQGVLNATTESNNTVIGGGLDFNAVGLNGMNNIGVFADGGQNIGYYQTFDSKSSIGTRVSLGGAITGLDVSAKVQIDSIYGGLLIPRLTTTEKNAILTPATGLQLYDTTLNQIQFYNGSAWVSTGLDGIYGGSGTLSTNTTITSNNYRLILSDVATASTSLLTMAKGIVPNIANVVQTISYEGASGGGLKASLYVTNDITSGASSQYGIQAKVLGWVIGAETVSISAQNGTGFLSPITNSDVCLLAGFTSGATNKNATAYGVYSTVQTTSSTTNIGGYFEAINGTSNNYALLTNGGQIGFNTITPDASTIVQIDSTTQGFLPPRMTTTQKNLITPATGLVVYDETLNLLQFYNGSSWISGSGGSTGIYGGSGSLSGATVVTTGVNDLTFSATTGQIIFNNNVAPNPVMIIDGATNTIGMGGNATFVEQLSIYNVTGSGNTIALGIHGNNTTGSQVGIDINVTAIATTNTALTITANGGTSNNYAIVTNGGQIGFGTVTPDASAILDVTSTTQGFLPPRLSTVERNAIASPLEGLMVYDTNLNQWMGWNKTAWVILG